MERLKTQGAAHPTSPFIAMEMREDGRVGRGDAKESEKGRENSRQVKILGEEMAEGGWEWEPVRGGGEWARAGHSSSFSTWGASGVSHLHFSLITSSPHSACGVTDTPRRATQAKKGLPTTLQLAL